MKISNFHNTLCTIFFLSSFLMQAQEVLKKTYVTKELPNNISPNIDGELNDAVWKDVPWGKDFIEKEPDENTAPENQTKFKILYDAKFLYVAFRCYDKEPDKIVKRMTRRDVFEGDRITLNLDSYNDKRTGFSFTISAAGVKGDEFISQNGQNWDDSWNPIWYAASAIDDKGWTAEIKIPFSQLKFGKSKEQQWGLQIVRQFFRTNERSVWQRVPRTVSGWVSEFGTLRGLFNIQPQKQLEIQPFTVLQYDTYPKVAGNPFKDGNDVGLNAGIDAKIGITNDLTLDITVNSDFGQVEADPGTIALDGFQVFFQEKRPFFVENKNIFDYRFANGQDNLFYSRRIGRSPHRSANIGAGEFADNPTNSTILGAAKFSGKTKDGWSIGVLESITDNMYAEIDAKGNRKKEIVEPLTNYFVARAQKDFNNRNSYIGGIFTATNRDLNGNFTETVKAAYTGGIDFKHNWNNRNYYVKGNFITSHVTGSKEAITELQESNTHLFNRVDATHVAVDVNRTSLTGTGGQLEVGKSGGGNWGFETGFNWRSPELELNDIGFLRQADEIRQYAEVKYNTLLSTDIYRQFNVKLQESSAFDFENNFNRLQFELQGEINWKNNWWTEGGLGYKPRIFINSFLRGGPRWRYSPENFFFMFAGTDNSKKFSAHLGFVRSITKDNNFQFKRNVLRLFYQPINSLKLSLVATFKENPNKTQYVSQQDFAGTKRYILGEIDQQTFSTSLRISYSVNPNLSVQFYGEPFISRGRYTNFNFVENATAEKLNDRVSWYTDKQITTNNNSFDVDENLDGIKDYSFSNPDFSYVQLRTNLVVRWEYIPGSEIFLVWSRGNSGAANPDDALFETINNEVLQKESDDTFLLKATYRFVL